MAVKHRIVECEQVDSRLTHLLRALQTYHSERGLPTQDLEVTKLCNSIVLSLGTINIPAKTDEYMKFMSDIRSLQEILSKAANNDFVIAILKALYNAISDPQQKQCSPTMSIVLQLVDVEFIPKAVRRILIAGYSDQSLEQALLTLCNWLSRWTFTPNLGPLVLTFMEGLESEHHYDILVEAAIIYVEPLFKLLILPEQRNFVGPVVLYMLSRVQHSPDAFHKIIPHTNKILTSLQNENSPSSHVYLKNIVNLCMALMEHFPGYPNLYDPLRQILTNFNPGINYKEILNCSSWSDTGNSVVSIQSVQGKVGLNNLGNTCYMNSVLQALFMTKKFRNDILVSTKDAMPLFAKLQVLFALLQHSQRNSLSPNDILNLARPPGFQPGHQHDSSEFLGYLLDVLHEQEKTIYSTLTNNDSAGTAQAGASALVTTIVQRSFGGRAVTISKCGNCDTQSERADNFRELQLSFPSVRDNQSVQTLLDYYLQPEKLCGDNQYHCDKCHGLTDGERVTRVAEHPPRLVLTLKHFHYDSASQQRTKLLHQVKLDSFVRLEGVLYELYAAVVHCGSNLDSGHYYTFAKDEQDWYKFNDCVVNSTTADALCSLRPPETPYILFYSRQDCVEPESLPRSSLSPRLEAALCRDHADFDMERRKRQVKTYTTRQNRNDEPPPPGCGGGGFIDASQSRFVC